MLGQEDKRRALEFLDLTEQQVDQATVWLTVNGLNEMKACGRAVDAVGQLKGRKVRVSLKSTKGFDSRYGVATWITSYAPWWVSDLWKSHYSSTALADQREHERHRDMLFVVKAWGIYLALLARGC